MLNYGQVDKQHIDKENNIISKGGHYYDKKNFNNRRNQ